METTFPRWALAGCKPQSMEILKRLATNGHYPEFISVPSNIGRDEQIALLASTQSTLLPGQMKEHLDVIQNLDVLLVCRYSILKPEIFNAPKLGTLNVHSSLLPQYRGVHPVSWVLVNGEKKTGVTVHRIDSGIDTGDVLKQRAIPIDDEDDIWSLTHRLNLLSADLVSETFAYLVRNKCLPTASRQEGKSSYARRRTPEDGELGLHFTVRQACNLVRALTPPLPQAFLKIAGKTFSVSQCKPTTQQSREEVKQVGQDRWLVRFADGFAELETKGVA